jgi:hypothetical protein
MRSVLTIGLSLLLEISCWSQTANFEAFALKLQNLKCRNEQVLLKKAFDLSHQTFLKKYKAYSQIEDIKSNGNYDCLSGTVFFSKLLDKLGFSYKIFETNYHIFIVAQTSKGDVLIEITDKNHGFVIDPFEIKDRLEYYKKNLSSASMYLAGVTIFNEINREEMDGLVLFNKAVLSYHQKDFVKSCEYLSQSEKIHHSIRINEFSKVLIAQISICNLDEVLKINLIAELKKLQSEKDSFASLN